MNLVEVPYSDWSVFRSAGAVLRGGNWNNNDNAGVFAVNLNNDVGFRCVFRPHWQTWGICNAWWKLMRQGKSAM